MMTSTLPETMYWMRFREYLVKNPQTGRYEWKPETPDRDRVVKSHKQWLKKF